MLEDRLATLGLLWLVRERQGEELTTGQWERPTRLGTWDVRSLCTHAAAWPFGFSKLLERVHDVAPTHQMAAALLREFNSPEGIAKRGAGEVEARARQDAATGGGGQHRDLEATVHLLDLRHALGLPPGVPAEGLAHTVAVLAEMAPPVDFIEVATGRSTVELFPVLTTLRRSVPIRGAEARRGIARRLVHRRFWPTSPPCKLSGGSTRVELREGRRHDRTRPSAAWRPPAAAHPRASATAGPHHRTAHSRAAPGARH